MPDNPDIWIRGVRINKRGLYLLHHRSDSLHPPLAKTSVAAVVLLHLRTWPWTKTPALLLPRSWRLRKTPVAAAMLHLQSRHVRKMMEASALLPLWTGPLGRMTFVTEKKSPLNEQTYTDSNSAVVSMKLSMLWVLSFTWPLQSVIQPRRMWYSHLYHIQNECDTASHYHTLL